jgi:glycosyltransferase involved in cell wall biosynthesis
MSHGAATRPFLSILIPAYNEEARLGVTLAKILAYLDAAGTDAEILVVDDGSKDKTAELATAALSGRRGRVLQNGENRGKGYSVRHGILEAQGRFVLLTDADLSTPITEHAKLAAAIRDEDLDVAIGSRALPTSDIQVRQAWLRQTMGRTFNRIIRVATGLPYHDTQCGFKLLFLCRRFGLSVKEVPVVWRNASGSKVSMVVDPVKMLLDVSRVRWRFRRGLYNPETVASARGR